MIRRHLRWLTAAIVVTGAVAPATAAERWTGLTAKVDMAAHVGAGEKALVEVTLRNDSPEDVFILQWQTPFRGLEHEIFDVRLDGREVAYLGPHIKFGPPRPEHYVRLAAGSSRTVRVDLGELYDFSRTGEYSVRYRVNVQDAIKPHTPVLEPVMLASNRVFVAVERPDTGFRPRADFARKPPSGGTYNRCDSSQVSAIQQAVVDGRNYASNASSYLQGGSTGPRYTTWFGTYDSTRYSRVRSNFSAISSAFNSAPLTFDCSCRQNYYAYVYPTQPYRIYLCRAFWSAPARGTDSKAGTLVHEVSHFNAVAGTDDHAYGQSACRSLAISSPGTAVDNADSHEYFAENTPAQN
jgi:peptidyl-Lys metalloendopeptidase